MRYAIAAFALFGLLATPALVITANADSMKNCAATWKGMSAADKGQTTYKDFSTKCLKGNSAPTAASPAMAAPAQPMTATSSMPAVPAAPAGATGMCNDGTYTKSKTHSGACSHHKGVAKWL
jgi:hypothetical protein